MIDTEVSEEYENLKEFVQDVNALRTGTWDGSFYQSDRPTPLQPRKEERMRDLIETYYPYLHFDKKAGGLNGLSSMHFRQLEPYFNGAYISAKARIKEIEE